MSSSLSGSVIEPVPFKGNDRLLFGIILGVIAFWLFAQTTLNVAPDMQKDLGLEPNLMNIAVAVTALFSGMFIVVMGGLADRVGRVRIVNFGFVLSIIGALLIALTPKGSFAVPVLMLGRAIQGISAACIMSASLALVKTYWDGKDRQRAVSLWSIGSWGGSGLCALFGGFVSQNFGWRWIFFACAAVSLLGMLMIRGTPESKVEGIGNRKLDLAGILTFMVTMVAVQIVVTQGNKLGWANPWILGLAAVTIVAGSLFIWFEYGNDQGFVDFRLFRNSTFTGATISNFLLNGVAGMLIVTLQLVQLGGNMSAQQAGMLTLGYAIAIIAFIRVGEKLLQRFGSRQPMIWGCLITGTSVVMMMPTHMMLDDYKTLSIVAYALMGIGLAFYATPSTDAALSSLPAAQAGSGAGIYKMASSLGGAFGIAISAAIFTALRFDNSSVTWLEGVFSFVGRQDNVPIRQAAMVALFFNVTLIAAAIVSIMMTIPKGKKTA